MPTTVTHGGCQCCGSVSQLCCPNLSGKTLHATFSAPGCACFDGAVVALAPDQPTGTTSWTGDLGSPCDCTGRSHLNFQLACHISPDGKTTHFAIIASACVAGTETVRVISCDPLELTANVSPPGPPAPFPCPCCSGISVTITL